MAAETKPQPRFIQYSKGVGQIEYLSIDRIVSASAKVTEEPDETEVQVKLSAGNGVLTIPLTGEPAFEVATALEELGFIPTPFREEVARGPR